MKGGDFMAISLTQKERMLLEDQKSHEELCIKKYQDYANKTEDAQLKQLFNDYAAQEQSHLNSINQLLSGQIPQMNQQQGQQNKVNGNLKGSFLSSPEDKNLCSDLLLDEKYVSGSYNTAIFEMTDTNVRQVLNHIQKEEQQHGEGIFNYMKSNGMYNVQ
jgi:spore coat protein CotF